MNIWAWVNELERDLRDNGNERLAHLIDSISGIALRGTAEEVSAVLPEALAGAREIGNPWLEVYFRHWAMQGRVSVGNEGDSALKDAVALFEFAHRQETENCPQSICVTQDLCLSFGNVDGPGWSDARIEVAEETLARINPSWPCYSCILIQVGEALIDGDRANEACVRLQQGFDALRATGSRLRNVDLTTLARALLAAGQVKEALRELDAASKLYGDADDNAHIAILRADCHARLGKAEVAWEGLPSWEPLRTCRKVSWVRVALPLLAKFPEHNTAELGQRISQLLAELSGKGAHRDVITISDAQIRLALGRHARTSAKYALAIARDHLPNLKAPLGADLLLEELEQRVAAMPVAELPVPATELAQYVAENSQGIGIDQLLDWLQQAREECPDDAELAAATARFSVTAGMADAAEILLWRYLEERPAVSPVAHQLLKQLLESRRFSEIDRFSELLRGSDPAYAEWALARRAHVLKRWPELKRHVARLMELDPDAWVGKNMLAEAALAEKDFSSLVRLREELAEHDPCAGRYWDLLIAASLAQDWPLVRAMAPLLDMKLSPGEGVVEENWESVLIRFFDDNKWATMVAQRTGPVTARVISCSATGRAQHIGDWLVFNPVLVEPMPEDKEERENFWATFDALHVLEHGNFGPSWLVDGVAPDAEAWQKLTFALQARGLQWWVNSADDYTVRDPVNEEQKLPGKYWLVAAPAAVSAAELDQLLQELTVSLPHPLCWLRLAEEAGGDFARHEEISERYEL